MKKLIPFLELASQHQQISGELKAKFAEILDVGLFSAGEEVVLFEENVRDLLNLPSAIACSNGTDALELALKALGVGKGDEVVVPALTWVSTAEAVVNVGAIPVFCDVDPDGLIAVSKAEKCLSPKTKAIIPVHLYGKMVDMRPLLRFSTQNKLKLIEDAAQAFGAVQEGRSAGAFGDIGCFSFYPTKNLGALGEAGLMTTQDQALAQKLRVILNHGQADKDVHTLVGRNSKIDTLQAAFLNVKIRHFREWQVKRKKLARLYLKELTGIEEMRLPEGILDENHNAHLFTIRLNQRDALSSYLEQQGIGTAVHYPSPITSTPIFKRPISFPMAEEISRTILSLPLHPFLKEEEVIWVARKVRQFFIS